MRAHTHHTNGPRAGAGDLRRALLAQRQKPPTPHEYTHYIPKYSFVTFSIGNKVQKLLSAAYFQNVAVLTYLMWPQARSGCVYFLFTGEIAWLPPCPIGWPSLLSPDQVAPLTTHLVL